MIPIQDSSSLFLYPGMINANLKSILWVKNCNPLNLVFFFTESPPCPTPNYSKSAEMHLLLPSSKSQFKITAFWELFPGQLLHLVPWEASSVECQAALSACFFFYYCSPSHPHSDDYRFWPHSNFPLTYPVLFVISENKKLFSYWLFPSCHNFYSQAFASSLNTHSPRH